MLLRVSSTNSRTPPRTRTRPTRDETRGRLFTAAASVFVRSGIAGASIEDICLEAGLTRGAFYSNFANKDELVLAMVTEHSERSLAEMQRLMAIAETPRRYLELIESPERRRDGPFGPDSVLYLEFLLHALRTPANRPAIADMHRRVLEHVESVVRRDAEQQGIELPIPVEEAAALIVAIDNGYLLAELMVPGSYAPGTFSRNLLVLQRLWAAAASSGAAPDVAADVAAGEEHDPRTV